MKRNVIALGVASAITMLAGNASAAVFANGSAGSMDVNPAGIGHQLVFPYFSTQSDNATLINIVNTDTANGKALKVRFRGAGNSDDIYDFQVLMSPGDVWTAAVTQNADGFSQLTTADKTCTIPSSVNGAFLNVNRLDSTKNTAAQTREGYIEVINMADIPLNAATTSLYAKIKHSNGVAACSGTAIDALVNDFSTVTAANAAGLVYPTTGLSGDWIILNQANTAAWSGSATALQVNGATLGGANLVFFPQTDASISAANVTGLLTADPLLNRGLVAAASFDFPDLSTPYAPGNANAGVQREDTTAALAVAGVANEFVSDDTIAAVTDLLFTQPMRRYYVAANYAATTSSAFVARNAYDATTGAWSAGAATVGGYNNSAYADAYYTSNQTTVVDRLICLKSVSFRSWDREETTTSQQFVISPGVSTTYNICGEAAVTSINNGGVTTGSALNGAVARNNIEVPYTDGWMSFNLGSTGLPVIGASFMRASNGAVNYGFAFPHKTKTGSAF